MQVIFNVEPCQDIFCSFDQVQSVKSLSRNLIRSNLKHQYFIDQDYIVERIHFIKVPIVHVLELYLLFHLLINNIHSRCANQRIRYIYKIGGDQVKQFRSKTWSRETGSRCQSQLCTCGSIIYQNSVHTTRQLLHYCKRRNLEVCLCGI